MRVSLFRVGNPALNPEQSTLSSVAYYSYIENYMLNEIVCIFLFHLNINASFTPLFTFIKYLWMDSNKLNSVGKKARNKSFGSSNFSPTNWRKWKKMNRKHEEKVWIAWMFCLSSKSLQMSGADKYYCSVRWNAKQEGKKKPPTRTVCWSEKLLEKNNGIITKNVLWN